MVPLDEARGLDIMATIKTGVFTSAKGTTFTTVPMKDVVRLVAHAIGETPEDIEKLVADPRGEFLMIWRPKAPKAAAPKVSKGPASEVTSAAHMMAQMQEMMRQFQAMQAAGAGTAPKPLTLPEAVKGRGQLGRKRAAG